ncbi:DUF6884 domain-containing protein [Amycolatopsis sp. NPDC059657]|uniref:DUF6884 domain-containing protein n=1 Tax=Amycolatopsis sp. NPDC059657 TaxID=3346899 RepID=UPI0036733DA7
MKLLEPEQGLIIVNCSREKLVTNAPVPSLELYQGACVPNLRERFPASTPYRSRVRILSAEHGLLLPDELISTYDRRLATKSEALRLHQHTVSRQLDFEFAKSPSMRHLLVVVEPLYLLALRRLFDRLAELETGSIITNPWSWEGLLGVLRLWGWE